MTRSQLRRIAGIGVLVMACVLSLSACRSAPGIAVYIGSDVITTATVEKSVAAGLADDSVAKVYSNDPVKYRQFVVQDLIASRVYDSTAAKYGVSVTEPEVDARLAAIFQTQDETAFYAGQAEQQGLTKDNIREQVRRFLLGEKISTAAGIDAALSDPALQKLYDDAKASDTSIQFGFITVADQPTADSVLAQLEADPSTYPALATQYPGSYTLPAIQKVTPDQIPAPLADGVSKTEPGKGFTLALAETGGIVVTFIGPYPTFESQRSTLEQQAAEQARTALSAELKKVQGTLHITINPRYGSLSDSGQLVPDDRGVVTLVDQPSQG